MLAGRGATWAGPVLRIGPAAGGGVAMGRGACTGAGGAGGTGLAGCGAGGCEGAVTLVAPRVEVGLDGEATCADAITGSSSPSNRIGERFMARSSVEDLQDAALSVCPP